MESKIHIRNEEKKVERKAGSRSCFHIPFPSRGISPRLRKYKKSQLGLDYLPIDGNINNINNKISKKGNESHVEINISSSTFQ